ncbi:SGNH/GDSL hydrolase family protein [Luteimonas mephitis]|uniref:SGNH/GDSL hydrolase family protein n=1 Tax=Luteimonas mephitis TaxID=83615 RepID=UPI0004208DD1|nr:GDSL-type esterase/lipase family protein [Luteimonas mephitis]
MTAARTTGGPLPPLRALRYLALGDSYTIGEGVAPEGRWPVQLAHALRAEGVMLGDPQIVAATGWTTDELAAALDAFDASNAFAGAASAASHSPSEGEELAAEAAPAKAKGGWDFVSLLIGVNNQYRGRGAEDYRGQFAGLLARAIGYAGGRAGRVLVLSIPDWGVTPYAAREGRDGAQVARELDLYNAVARETCDRHDVAFVDITTTSRDRGDEADMLAEDGLHPSAAMYARWSRLALPVARRLLAR